jgi:dTDP-glucose 4,6-dehydratase
MTTCLVTGAAGFIGSHLVDYLLKNTDWKVMVWDSLTYASPDVKRLEKIGAYDYCPHRFNFRQIDICHSAFGAEKGLFSERALDPDFIVHLAAESHVDRSIVDPMEALNTNIYGTFSMLQKARYWKSLKKFLFFSTDEVFGPATGEPFHEWARYNSSNPYAATKAAGEELALAWANTYGVPVVISHCCNVFGERQHEEKFIPKLVRQISNGETVSIHSRPDGTSGSRMYVYAGDVARAIHLMLERGETRTKYNIPGTEITNMEMAVLVAHILDKPLRSVEEYPFALRPGWDFSYRITGESLYGLTWKPTNDFEGLLSRVVKSYAKT